jgi:hypothetical protein
MPPEALACLAAVAAAGLGRAISLGGGLGLLHYLDYRTTHDADAWWTAEATADDRRRVVTTIEETLRRFGAVRTRRWGEVVSVEMREGEIRPFSFQIAERSALLEPMVPIPSGDVLLDSLADIVASKMVALVERGAPRDFRDIHAVCQAGLVTPPECWVLWTRRQTAAGSDVDHGRARLAVETHLARISQHRRLDQITESGEREAAERVRTWFSREFLDALA